MDTLKETQSHMATLEQQKEHDRYTIQNLIREKQALQVENDRLSRIHP
jgi:regulator of replication initiation timing